MGDVPDSKGRLEILKVHAKNKRVNPEISLAEIAKRVPGFSGADLANLITRRPSSAGAATRTRSPPWRSTTRSTASCGHGGHQADRRQGQEPRGLPRGGARY